MPSGNPPPSLSAARRPRLAIDNARPSVPIYIRIYINLNTRSPVIVARLFRETSPLGIFQRGNKDVGQRSREMNFYFFLSIFRKPFCAIIKIENRLQQDLFMMTKRTFFYLTLCEPLYFHPR